MKDREMDRNYSNFHVIASYRGEISVVYSGRSTRDTFDVGVVSLSSKAVPL